MQSFTQTHIRAHKTRCLSTSSYGNKMQKT